MVSKEDLAKLDKALDSAQINLVLAQSIMNELMARENTAEAPKPKNKLAAVAEVALVEAKKNLKWMGAESEAEKYIKPYRKILDYNDTSSRPPWCACFVHWCYTKAGVEVPFVLPTGGTMAFCPSIETWARKMGTWHSAKDTAYNPPPGTMILYDFNPNDLDARPEHIGIVIEYIPGSTTIKTAEGNTSSASDANGNQTAVRTRNWASIKGFVEIK